MTPEPQSEVALPSPAALRTQLNAREPGYHWRSLAVLLAAMILLGILSGMSFQPSGALALVGALLLHELGHAAAMKLLGWREVRVFGVPLLGMSAADHARAVSDGRKGAVLLAGPLPGLLLGFALAFTAAPEAKTFQWNLVLTLTGLNALQLLPLEPFDGGKLVAFELPARARVLDVVTLVVATAALAALAFSLRSVTLGIVAFVVLSTIGRRINAWLVSRELSKRQPAVVGRVEDAPDDELQFLQQQVQQKVIQSAFYPKADRLLSVTAEWVRSIHDRARPAAPVGTALALLAGHLIGWALAVATFALLYGVPR